MPGGSARRHKSIPSRRPKPVWPSGGSPGVRPADLNPREGYPFDSEPMKMFPIDRNPVERYPIDLKLLETSPVDSKSVEAAPVHQKPAEASPVDQKAAGSLCKIDRGNKSADGDCAYAPPLDHVCEPSMGRAYEAQMDRLCKPPMEPARADLPLNCRRGLLRSAHTQRAREGRQA